MGGARCLTLRSFAATDCCSCSTGFACLLDRRLASDAPRPARTCTLGGVIYRQLGKPIDERCSLIDSDGWHAKSDGYFQLAKSNRYRWFGKAEDCALLSEEQRVPALDPTRQVSKLLRRPLEL